jgi:uncharacterized membrane protein required for colicin V production
VSERHKPGKRSAKEVVPPLILGTVGTIGVVVLYFLSPDFFQPIELILLLVVVGFAAVGYTQRIVRGLMMAAIIYVATGVAATFYVITAPYIGAPFGDFTEEAPPLGIKAFSFVVLTVVIWIALEAIGRAFLKDTSLPGLRILDNLGGLLVYLVIGVLVATLLFNTIGYSQRWRRVHDKAALRSAFNQVLSLHYTAQSFWFPGKPPPIYVYDLDLP